MYGIHYNISLNRKTMCYFEVLQIKRGLMRQLGRRRQKSPCAADVTLCPSD